MKRSALLLFALSPLTSFCQSGTFTIMRVAGRPKAESVTTLQTQAAYILIHRLLRPAFVCAGLRPIANHLTSQTYQPAM